MSRIRRDDHDDTRRMAKLGKRQISHLKKKKKKKKKTKRTESSMRTLVSELSGSSYSWPRLGEKLDLTARHAQTLSQGCHLEHVEEPLPRDIRGRWFKFTLPFPTVCICCWRQITSGELAIHHPHPFPLDSCFAGHELNRPLNTPPFPINVTHFLVRSALERV